MLSRGLGTGGSRELKGWYAMRKTAFVLSVAAVLISSAALAQGIDPELLGTWRVVEIDGRPAEHGEMFRFADGQIDGRSACNSVRAKVKQAGSALAIGKLTITARSCGSGRTADVRRRWEAERRYLNALGAIRGYRVADDDLSLTDADGRVLVSLSK